MTTKEKLYITTVYTVRVKKKLPIPFTVSPFSVPFSASFRFTVLPFRSPFYRSPFTVLPFRFAVLPFYRSKLDYRKSGDSGRVSRGPKAWEV